MPADLRTCFLRRDDMTRMTLLGLLLLAAPTRGQTPSTDADTLFESRIRPVLVDTCFKCHGGKKVSHGLRVDSREALLKGGDTGPALLPGDPDRSLLVQALRHTHDSIKMPPGQRLPDAVVADFATWVKQGAVWPKTASSQAQPFPSQRHWAFQPVTRGSPPPDPSGWSDHPIDRFVMARLRDQHLQPVGLADKRTLLRRVTFDLIGLPPTPDEVADFLADHSPAAFAKVVDRLLASPHYGERWGRHWLDVVRYADTAGDNADYPIPEVRLYRDYVIDSFNADKPYDQFVQEQLAGDLLAKQGPRDRYTERVIATGFLALSRRYATAPYEFWHLTMEDTIDTTGRAFLGLTLRCARCHDHKFDPITTEDYYALYGFFASTQFPWPGGEEFASKQFPRQHFAPLLPPEEAAPLQASFQQKLQQLDTELRRTEKESPLAKRLAELNRQLEAKAKQLQELEARKQNAEALKAEWAALQKERDASNGQLQARLNQLRRDRGNLVKPGLPANLPGAYAVQDGQPVDMYVHLRGEVEQHGPIVKRGVPRFLAGDQPLAIPAGASGRLQFAQWLTRPEHPLTARVMVNRIWQHHFGKGLVTTPSNFGLHGEAPTHPELLDWLAARFIESGWSIKAMHRLILLSKTYQLASSHDDRNAATDPANRWYWRFDRRRLDAEAIRDALLLVSGKLDRTRPGAHPFPPIAKWTWTQHTPFKEVYPSYHRSVYLMTQRFQRHPYLALFDGPDTNTSTEQRTSSTVPQQALFLMNNPFMVEQAEGLARRVIGVSNDPVRRIDSAHQWAWSRPPQPVEIEKAIRYLTAYEQQLAKTNVSGERQELEAWTSFGRILLSANEFVYLD
jgi:hypothetical protein